MKNRITVALVIALLTLSGCEKRIENLPALKKAAPMVQTTSVHQGKLVKNVIFTGSVEPVKAATMASPAEGPVTRCPIREGDLVAPGQLLVQVGRRSSAAAALAAARDELRQYESEFKRAEQLVHQGLLPGAKLDEARSNLRNAQAQLAAMETSESDYRVIAPWAGVVSKVWISEGNYVVPRAPMVELYDPASMVVHIAVPEKYALAMRTGSLVQARLDAYPGKIFLAEITRVYPELDRQTRVVTVEVEIKESIKLMSGMFARVEVAVEAVENALIFPQSALTVRPDGSVYVFVLKGKTVHEIEVNPVLEADGKVAVFKGLNAQDVVVIKGNLSLKDGVKVTVKAAKSGEKP